MVFFLGNKILEYTHNVILLLYQIINKGFILILNKMLNKSYYDEQLNYIFAQGRGYSFKAQ